MITTGVSAVSDQDLKTILGTSDPMVLQALIHHATDDESVADINDEAVPTPSVGGVGTARRRALD